MLQLFLGRERHIHAVRCGCKLRLRPNDKPSAPKNEDSRWPLGAAHCSALRQGTNYVHPFRRTETDGLERSIHANTSMEGYSSWVDLPREIGIVHPCATGT